MSEQGKALEDALADLSALIEDDRDGQLAIEAARQAYAQVEAKYQRLESLCRAEQLTANTMRAERDARPTWDMVRDALGVAMHLAVGLDAEHDVDPDKHWPKQIDAIIAEMKEKQDE